MPDNCYLVWGSLLLDYHYGQDVKNILSEIQAVSLNKKYNLELFNTVLCTRFGC